MPEERLRAAIDLALAHPEAKLLYSGRSGALFGASPVQIIQDAGIVPERVTIEHASRTTAQNAVNAAAAVGDAIEGKWVLVTSAYHMRRAVAAFHQVGWHNLTTYPVIHGRGPHQRTPTANLAALNIALKEIVGEIGYRLTGRA